MTKTMAAMLPKACAGLIVRQSAKLHVFRINASYLQGERQVGYSFGLRGSREASVRSRVNEAKARGNERELRAEGERSHDAVGSISG